MVDLRDFESRLHSGKSSTNLAFDRWAQLRELFERYVGDPGLQIIPGVVFVGLALPELLLFSIRASDFGAVAEDSPISSSPGNSSYPEAL